MNIWIFGDSYCENFPAHPSWSQTIDNSLTVKNFCKGGTGPIKAFEIFDSKIEDIHIDDCVIFFLSNPYRIDFKTLNDEESYYLQKYIQTGDFTVLNNSDFSSELRIFAHDFRKIFDTELKIMNYKNLAFLKNFSENKKIKTLVFTCFSTIDENCIDYACDIENFNDVNLEKYGLIDMDSEYFKFVNTPLYLVALHENTQKKITDKYRFNANHLSKENNKIIQNIVLNFILNTNYTEIFIENIFSEDIINNKSFVYD